MRVLELVGFRKEHWGYDYPPEYAEYRKTFTELTTATGKPNSILLAGVVRTGKTAMLAKICDILFTGYCLGQWLNKTKSSVAAMADYFAKDVKYCTHSELADIWSNEFNDSSELPTEDYFKKAQVLFLDDLFSAPVNVSGRNTAKLEELIDWRWSNHLKTFIATNISLKDLWKNKQYARIARRLSEKDWIHYQILTHKFNEETK